MDAKEIFSLFVNIGLPHCILLSAALFSIGLFGLLTRRNVIAILMSVELMLNAVNINLVAFNHFRPVSDYAGQLLALFGIVVAAAEVAIGMALAVRLYREKKGVNLEDLNELKG